MFSTAHQRCDHPETVHHDHHEVGSKILFQTSNIKQKWVNSADRRGRLLALMRNDNGVFSTLMENMFSFNNIQQEEECEKCSYEGEGEYKRIRYIMVSVSVGLSAFIIMHICRWGEVKSYWSSWCLHYVCALKKNQWFEEMVLI